MGRTLKIGFLLFGILSLDMVEWTESPGAAGEVRIENRTGYDLVEIYVAPTSRPAWGKNLLAGGTLREGGTVRFVPGSTGEEDVIVGRERFFDILAVDIDGDRYLQSGVDLRKDPVVVLSFKDFLEPRSEGWGREEYFERYGDEVTEHSAQE
ncbi:MAG: hypothetical protein Kow009_02640 [Spirochaetales bacterium]